MTVKCVACFDTGECEYCSGTGRAVKKTLFEWLGEVLRGSGEKRVR
jgi:hypothetical protein